MAGEVAAALRGRVEDKYPQRQQYVHSASASLPISLPLSSLQHKSVHWQNTDEKRQQPRRASPVHCRTAAARTDAHLARSPPSTARLLPPLAVRRLFATVRRLFATVRRLFATVRRLFATVRLHTAVHYPLADVRCLHSPSSHLMRAACPSGYCCVRSKAFTSTNTSLFRTPRAVTRRQSARRGQEGD
ncbi:hypothetical protein GGX14DRAFT_574719 [Mycena pura]|uniref:Uncharacterized protein n=1 Tax=Mycena pura TaxID=153505 RepID=A0AAD6Y6L5_9AGAR|nr:hypothetical protein GGX14DRAFT_574719 [Mycena pura]